MDKFRRVNFIGVGRCEIDTDLVFGVHLVQGAAPQKLLGELESLEYRKFKQEHGSTIARLEMQFSEIAVQKSNSSNIKRLSQDAVNALLELDKLYDLASVPAKRYLVGLLFPEKMVYLNGTCRTGRLNKAAELIYVENKQLRAKKMGQKPLKKSLPHKGWKDMLLSSDFLCDLGMLAKLRQRMMEIDPQLPPRNLMK